MKNSRLHIVLSLFTFLFIYNSTNIAQNFYVDGHIGYGFPINGSTNFLENETNYYDNSIQPSQYKNETEVVKLSLGQGFNFGANAGYMFNENFGLDLGLNYQIGSKVNFNYSSTNISEDQNGNLVTITNKNEGSMSSNMFHITPSLVLKTEMGKFSPYTKLGFVMGLGSINHAFDGSSERTNQGSVTDGFNYELNYEFTGNLAYGFEGAIGTTFPINEKLVMYSEVFFRSMSYTPGKYTITKYEEDNVDLLDQIPVSEKEINLVKETTYDPNQSDDSPSQQTLIRFPYNSLGLKIGVRFNL